MSDIRPLRADEIECRVSQIKVNEENPKKTGCSLLLYKDARCDMRILDEVFGPMNWRRQHEEIGGRLYCTLFVRDPATNEWVDKQDVGTESNAEKEKGQASDSFKRAGFNWGIGRELYTAPFIWIPLAEGEYYKRGANYATNLRFTVTEIEYNERREISRLVISDKKQVRFTFGAQQSEDDKIEPIGDVERETLKKVVIALTGEWTAKSIHQATGLSSAQIKSLTKPGWGELMVKLNRQMDDANHKAAMDA